MPKLSAKIQSDTNCGALVRQISKMLLSCVGADTYWERHLLGETIIKKQMQLCVMDSITRSTMQIPIDIRQI